MKNSHFDRILRYFLTSLNHDLTSLKDELFVLESIPADFSRGADVLNVKEAVFGN